MNSLRKNSARIASHSTHSFVLTDFFMLQRVLWRVMVSRHAENFFLKYAHVHKLRDSTVSFSSHSLRKFSFLVVIFMGNWMETSWGSVAWHCYVEANVVHSDFPGSIPDLDLFTAFLPLLALLYFLSSL